MGSKVWMTDDYPEFERELALATDPPLPSWADDDPIVHYERTMSDVEAEPDGTIVDNGA
jgi:hypothetical protein